MQTRTRQNSGTSQTIAAIALFLMSLYPAVQQVLQ